jgi:hypothetical protein
MANKIPYTNGTTNGVQGFFDVDKFIKELKEEAEEFPATCGYCRKEYNGLEGSRIELETETIDMCPECVEECTQ